MNMSRILCKVSDEDAKKLIDTIIEVEACKELYDESMKRVDVVPVALKTILDYYMYTLKIHKTLWMELLVKYIGEDDATMYLKILRFNRVKKVIFQLEIEGCALCKN